MLEDDDEEEDAALSVGTAAPMAAVADCQPARA